MKILFLGEIVSKPGIFTLKSLLPSLKEKYKPDITIANADGATGGFGLGKNHAMYLRKVGVDVITGGDQIYFKKDMTAGIDQLYHVLRPSNFPSGNPGRGWKSVQIGNKKLVIISLLGQAGFSRVHLSNPFTLLSEVILKKLDADVKHIFVDFHSVTTAEKATMSLYLDGKVSAIIGTGMRVLTADAEILPGGTAMLSDAGRTGSIQSVNGFDPKYEIQQFVNGVPERSVDFWQGLEAQGCFLELDDEGKAVKIESFRIPCTAKPQPKEEIGDAGFEDSN